MASNESRTDDMEIGLRRAKTINLAERFAASDRFKALFREGMALVEETAAYLDGEGRVTAKVLHRQSAMVYGSESMRLTTRLMQLASWLLLQRAVTEGEMTRQQLLHEKKKIHLESMADERHSTAGTDLPEPFVDLVRRSLALQKRILVLDREIYGEPNLPELNLGARNPVDQQINLLSAAFGAKIRR
jgi:regulator of CtrA degradation